MLLLLFWVMLLYTITRILFITFNLTHFSGLGIAETFGVLFHGLRFDLAALCFTNAVLIILVLFPYNLLQWKTFRHLAAGLYIVVNGIALLANCADFVYFRFTAKRSTWDVFQLMFSGQSDFFSLLPRFIKDYWYVLLVFIMILFCLRILYRKTAKKYLNFTEQQKSIQDVAYRIVAFVLLGAFTVLGMRGGLQLIPIGLVNAGDQVESHYIPAVLNTPFSIIKSIELKVLEEKNYFPQEELGKYVNPIKKPNTTSPQAFRKENLVIIILESFSKEYTALGKRKSFTPFLDSLMQQSLVFTNAYANGKRSIEGIPAILGGIPSFHEPYINTIYNSNQIQSLASLLKREGYASSFYHGGTNGTMSFNSFCSLAGFDKYAGRQEYNNEADYDGHWGIWDGPFFRFFSEELNKQPQPFLASFFSLSSHHPFAVPEQYKDKFPKGTQPIHPCIAYTDLMLKEFFDKIKKESWFKNTLFVITADHTGTSDDPFYYNPLGNYQVPLLFYKADGSLKGTDTSVAQQIDILPSCLSYLGYAHPYFAFGNNLFAGNKERYCVNADNNEYQIVTDNYFIRFDGAKCSGCFRYKTDSLLKNAIPVLGSEESRLAEKRLKAFIQQYNYSLIHNKSSFP